MEIENLLNLFDSYWFDLNFFTKKPSKNTKIIPDMPPTNTEIIPSLPTIHTKKKPVEKPLISSSNNNNNINKNSYSPIKNNDSTFSPNSVLLSPKLQTIFSGKVSEEFEESSEKEKTPQSVTTSTKNVSSNTSPLKGNNVISQNRRRKKKGLSKSLSDLEFEELKGFMDLGFVFSEEDVNDSNLASIIPGLQRLGNNINNNNSGTNINISSNASNNIIMNNNVDENNNSNISNNSNNKEKVEISRPYLSEAWEVMERKRRESEVLRTRVPDPNSQVQMKDYLRCWAHTVASTVR